MDTFAADLRYTLRTLRRSPLFSLFAVLSLALGIGANVAIFTCLKAVLFERLPVAEPARVAAVFATHTSTPELLPVSYPNFRDFRDGNDFFTGMMAVRPIAARLASGNGEPEQVLGEIVSGNYFDLLGVEPALGRTFLPEEDKTPGTHLVVVLSHGLWQRRFGADPKVVGRTVRLNGHPFTVVGIAPPGFTGLGLLERHDVWVPFMAHDQVLFGIFREWIERRDAVIWSAYGRLKPGVSLRQAEAAMATLASRLRQEYPVENEGTGATLRPLSQATIDPNQRGGFVLVGALLMTVVGLLLIVACVNVANLLLARAMARRGEIAVRVSLGAGRGRLVRQMLTEGVVLALLGGAAGLLLAVWVRDLLWAARPPFLPEHLNVGLDGRALAFALALTLVTGLLFGLAPMLHLSDPRLITALRQRTGADRALGRFDLRRFLVVLQVALSFISLAGAGLFLSSLRQGQRTDPGFAADQLVAVSFDLGSQGYDEPRGRQFYRQLVERIEAVPGVRSAATASGLMLAEGQMRLALQPEGQEPINGGEGLPVRANRVDPGYLETVDVPLVAGRDFTAADGPEAPRVAIVNRTLASRVWPGQDAVGRRFRFAGEEDAPVEVIGVAADSKYGSLDEPPQPYVYLAFPQHYAPAAFLHVRAERDAASLVGPVRSAARSLDPEVVATDGRVLADIVASSLWAPRATAALLTVFGFLALVLSAIGIYSLMAYAVAQRRREIGIRMALGAGRRDVVRMVLSQGLLIVALGLGLGVAAALASAPAVASLLFGVRPHDPAIFAGAALLLAGVAFVANYLPARRATAVDPIAVLRDE